MLKRLSALLLAMLMLLSACGRPPAKENPAQTKPVTDSAPGKESGKTPDKVSESAPLMAEAESQEAAEELAELYGITLVEFRSGLATFFTEEEPKEVIRRGQEKGWPELTLNRGSRAS